MRLSLHFGRTLATARLNGSARDFAEEEKHNTACRHRWICSGHQGSRILFLDAGSWRLMAMQGHNQSGD